MLKMRCLIIKALQNKVYVYMYDARYAFQRLLKCRGQLFEARLA